MPHTTVRLHLLTVLLVPLMSAAGVPPTISLPYLTELDGTGGDGGGILTIPKVENRYEVSKCRPRKPQY